MFAELLIYLAAILLRSKDRRACACVEIDESDCLYWRLVNLRVPFVNAICQQAHARRKAIEWWDLSDYGTPYCQMCSKWDTDWRPFFAALSLNECKYIEHYVSPGCRNRYCGFGINKPHKLADHNQNICTKSQCQHYGKLHCKQDCRKDASDLKVPMTENTEKIYSPSTREIMKLCHKLTQVEQQDGVIIHKLSFYANSAFANPVVALDEILVHFYNEIAISEAEKITEIFEMFDSVSLKLFNVPWEENANRENICDTQNQMNIFLQKCISGWLVDAWKTQPTEGDRSNPDALRLAICNAKRRLDFHHAASLEWYLQQCDCAHVPEASAQTIVEHIGQCAPIGMVMLVPQNWDKSIKGKHGKR